MRKVNYVFLTVVVAVVVFLFCGVSSSEVVEKARKNYQIERIPAMAPGMLQAIEKSKGETIDTKQSLEEQKSGVHIPTPPDDDRKKLADIDIGPVRGGSIPVANFTQKDFSNLVPIPERTVRDGKRPKVSPVDRDKLKPPEPTRWDIGYFAPKRGFSYYTPIRGTLISTYDDYSLFGASSIMSTISSYKYMGDDEFEEDDIVYSIDSPIIRPDLS